MLVVAAGLYIVELVADKIPYFDSLWDAVSTAIRPTVGAVIGLLMAQDAPTLEQAVLAASRRGGRIGVAPGQGRPAADRQHLARAREQHRRERRRGRRRGRGDDACAVLNPVLALTIATILLALGILLLVLLLVAGALRGWRRFRAWRAHGRQPKKTSASA